MGYNALNDYVAIVDAFERLKKEDVRGPHMEAIRLAVNVLARHTADTGMEEWDNFSRRAYDLSQPPYTKLVR